MLPLATRNGPIIKKYSRRIYISTIPLCEKIFSCFAHSEKPIMNIQPTAAHEQPLPVIALGQFSSDIASPAPRLAAPKVAASMKNGTAQRSGRPSRCRYRASGTHRGSADVFDALTSVRPYTPAWPLAGAIAFIESRAGSHFDPQVVTHFQRCRPQLLAIRANNMEPDV